MKRIVGGIAAIALSMSLLVPLALSTDMDSATAAAGSGFDAGNIISDENFFDSNAMSEAAIQTFLESQNCSPRNGVACLENFAMTTPTVAAVGNGHCAQYAGGNNESASRIIAKVAQACRINPKVLLVLLQKEQSLITSPSTYGYARAMGWGCPDSGPNFSANCDANYFGFFNQTYKSAWQFRQYTQYPVNIPGGGVRNYRIGTVFIQYHPNAGCGGSQVNIVNQATANLYLYTPYQPNASALNNLYGSGDACGAYGNRNFWRIYTDWFGTTQTSRYSSVDKVSGVYGGVSVEGWSYDPTTPDSAYIWVNVDGVGGAYRANKPLSWFNTLFPNYGPNHGFAERIPASPGSHQVCIHGSLGLIQCTWVNVPYGQAGFDTATAVWGGVDISGWAVDFTSEAPSYIWVNVDGVGSAYRADEQLGWIDSYFSGVGSDHGYSFSIPASSGSRKVCVSGIYGGISELISCKVVVVPRGAGALDTAVAKPGGIAITGWSADAERPDASFIWVNVDGNGGAYRTNEARPWLPNHLSGIGVNNGYNLRLPARKGPHKVCVTGASALLGCRTVVVEKSADGSVDSIVAVDGGVRLTGWSVDLTTSAPAWIWVNLNGEGGAHAANVPLGWFDAYYPGSGPNHGFDVTISKPPGTYEVCVHGTESLLRCQSVSVR